MIDFIEQAMATQKHAAEQFKKESKMTEEFTYTVEVRPTEKTNEMLAHFERHIKELKETFDALKKSDRLFEGKLISEHEFPTVNSWANDGRRRVTQADVDSLLWHREALIALTDEFALKAPHNFDRFRKVVDAVKVTEETYI